MQNVLYLLEIGILCLVRQVGGSQQVDKLLSFTIPSQSAIPDYNLLFSLVKKLNAILPCHAVLHRKFPNRGWKLALLLVRQSLPKNPSFSNFFENYTLRHIGGGEKAGKLVHSMHKPIYHLEAKVCGTFHFLCECNLLSLLGNSSSSCRFPSKTKKKDTGFWFLKGEQG